MTIRELRKKIEEVRSIATLQKLYGEDISKYTAEIQELEEQIFREQQEREKEQEKLQKFRQAMGLK